ncbi:helix-turn-helix transcriptional regulator [Streptomyces avicenniae]|uniref:helix-turn-helix transcriptional regulator n=1 Tax=Streptomyces avicenniae TaxID=500153 RepID=UPI00069C50CC|nr:helix-turn-helix transcriptional regulator [Streptomyces avicenniae]
MPHSADEHTGARIADYRKLRGLTQQALAARAFANRGTIAKVEAGLAAASPALVAAVARALSVDPGALHGQPYLPELQQDRLDRIIAPLSEALDLYDLGPDPAITPRSPRVLLGQVDHLMRLTRQAEYVRIGALLPGLLGELTTAQVLASGAEERRLLAGALASTYRTAHEFAYRLGYTDLGLVALERMGWAGHMADDPLMLAVRLYRRGLMALGRSGPGTAQRVLARGQALVGQSDDPRGTAARAVSGELHMTAAVVAAREGDTARADEHLQQAAEHATLIGEDVPEVYWLSFGPTDVRRRQVETALELGRHGAAIVAARDLRFGPGHSPMRVGRHHITMARLYAQIGKAEAAERHLSRAREVTPQQVRYNPLARDVIMLLVRRRRRAHGSLTALAEWIGVV